MRRECASHPAFLLDHVRCIDNTDGTDFKFELLDERSGWYWQRGLLDEWLASNKHVSLKARQLGVTWLASGLALWTALYKPGSRSLIVSIKEKDAIKVLNHVWDMLTSLPDYLWNGAKVLRPHNARPTSEIQLEFPDGKVSRVEGLAQSPSAGHGATSALVVLDEFARQEYAEETWTAVLPTTQGGGRVIVISTGWGVSTPDGGGNFFHYLWQNSKALNLNSRFLPWDLHPDRDEPWYQEWAVPLPPHRRGEQYPRNPREAFILTGRPFFDPDMFDHYEGRVREPLFRFDFEPVGRGKARFRKWDFGRISVWERPREDRSYAIGCDVATGRGLDFSCAYVIDLADMQLVAEIHGKLDADLYAEQLHYLGRWYNGALVAVEKAGGYGEVVTTSLRDGRKDRPAYPRLYRHMPSNSADPYTAKDYGFPMTQKTRPLVINQLEQAVRERHLPFLPGDLLAEMMTFVERDTTPSPRAQDGANDDRVMAAALTLEMYRQKGRHPEREERIARRRSGRSRKKLTQYPWQRPAEAA